MIGIGWVVVIAVGALVVGVYFGMVIMALLVVSKRADAHLGEEQEAPSQGLYEEIQL